MEERAYSKPWVRVRVRVRGSRMPRQARGRWSEGPWVERGPVGGGACLADLALDRVGLLVHLIKVRVEAGVKAGVIWSRGGWGQG